jgi:hypothetical protein
MKKGRLFFLISIIVFSSCEKRNNETQALQDIPEEVVSTIKKMGYSTYGITKFRDGYIVEKDIYFPSAYLKLKQAETSEVLAQTEQYSTTNLVQFWPRMITISVENMPLFYSNALDEAIARYNRLNLGLTFSRVNGANSDMVVRGFFSTLPGAPLAFVGLGGGDILSGFPANGNPARFININTALLTTNSNLLYVASVTQHEIGHTIGMRHTDFMNTTFSCFGGGDEGAGQIGANHIPGTPTVPDAHSFMLACIGNSVNRSFNTNDILALAHLYNFNNTPEPQVIYEYYNPSRTNHSLSSSSNIPIQFSGWNFLTSTFRARITQVAGTVPIYQFYNQQLGDHVYSPNINAVSAFPGWQLDGVAFFAYSTQVAGSIPIYNFYNFNLKDHVYSSNPNAVAGFPGWAYHGIAFYALPL